MKIRYATTRGEKTYIKKIVDDNTIQRLTTAKLLDLPFKEIDPEKDQRWNMKKVNSELLQAFDNGETIKEMSERLERVSDMDKVAAIRNARTMTTSFENLGRLDGMKTMKENGTILKKQWLATVSTKKHPTRDWHKELSGQIAEVDEPFINHPPSGKKKVEEKIMYPGDPNASAANIYNCRCTLTTVVEGFEPTLPKGTIISVEDNESNSGWMPNFDDYDIYDLQDCLHRIGKTFSELSKMSKDEMKSELEKFYMRTSKKIKQFKKTKDVEKIAELLQSLPKESIPERFNRDSLFQRYTLFELNGDLPDVVDDLSKVQGTNIYRGVWDAQNITGKEICDMTRYDPEGYVGDGAYGDGTYFSTDKSTAESYGGYEYGGFIEAKLKPTAKVIEYEDIRNKGVDHNQVSIWAVLNGYDVIKKPMSQSDTYYNVLKRSALWVKK